MSVAMKLAVVLLNQGEGLKMTADCGLEATSRASRSPRLRRSWVWASTHKSAFNAMIPFLTTLITGVILLSCPGAILRFE